MKNTRFQLLAQLMIVCFAPIMVRAQSYTMTTIAGTSRLRDNTTATTAPIRAPWGLVTDNAGNIYFADGPDHRVRRVGADGRITTIAGTGVPGYSGDNGPAINARLDAPRGLALDQLGNLYIGDYFNNVVRKIVLATGVITTIAGNGNYTFAGDGGPATQATMDRPHGICVGPDNAVYIGDTINHRVRVVK